MPTKLTDNKQVQLTLLGFHLDDEGLALLRAAIEANRVEMDRLQYLVTSQYQQGKPL